MTTPELVGIQSGQSSRDRPRYVRSARALSRFMTTKKTGAFGLIIVLIVVLLAIVGPWIVPYSKDTVFQKANPKFDVNSLKLDALNPFTLSALDWPSRSHPLGTDDKGRDLLTRIILGARLSVEVGVGSAALGLLGGMLVGIISGYLGGIVDLVTQRIVDATIAIPSIIFLLLLVQVSQPSLLVVTLALSFLGMFSASRVVRSSVLTVRNEAYIDAARVMGGNAVRVMVVHVLPNVVAPMIVIFTISIGANILAEAALSFLGLGVPGPSWGQMVSQGRTFIDTQPVMNLAGGGAITLTVLGFNLFGDSLRDVLDPRQRSGR